jgi:hypothetical protein
MAAVSKDDVKRTDAAKMLVPVYSLFKRGFSLAILDANGNRVPLTPPDVAATRLHTPVSLSGPACIEAIAQLVDDDYGLEVINDSDTASEVDIIRNCDYYSFYLTADGGRETLTLTTDDDHEAANDKTTTGSKPAALPSKY